jgi:hypothetical protein
MNYKKLKLKIKEVFDTQDAFADAMEMGRVSLNQRLNNVVQWTTSDIAKACDLLGIPLEEAHLYFFTPEV